MLQVSFKYNSIPQNWSYF